MDKELFKDLITSVKQAGKIMQARRKAEKQEAESKTPKYKKKK